MNLGAWRFRADYQYQYNRSQGKTNQRFDWTQFYAFRAFPELGAKILLGESYLRTELFDSFRFVGASLFSDTRMLPLRCVVMRHKFQELPKRMQWSLLLKMGV